MFYVHLGVPAVIWLTLAAFITWTIENHVRFKIYELRYNYKAGSREIKGEVEYEQSLKEYTNEFKVLRFFRKGILLFLVFTAFAEILLKIHGVTS